MDATNLHRPSAASGDAVGLSHAASAYDISAAVAIIFNWVLAWLKDSYASLNTTMAHTLGHQHHGVVVVAIVILVGFGLAPTRRLADPSGGRFMAPVISMAKPGSDCSRGSPLFDSGRQN